MVFELWHWLHLAALLALMGLLRRGLLRYACHSDWVYREPSVLLAGLRRPKFRRLSAAVLIPSALALVWAPWGVMGDGGATRLVVSVAAGIVAWSASTIAFNPYFGQRYTLDRALCAALGVGCALHPACIPALLLVADGLEAQSRRPASVPLSGQDGEGPHDLVVLFAAFLPLQILLGAPAWIFLVAAVALLAAHYFYAALAKLAIGRGPWVWPAKNRLDFLLRTTWHHGWLGFLGEERVLRLSRVARALSVPMQVLTIVIELGAVLMLADPGVAIVLLAGTIAMHIGILLGSGICFWRWVLTNAALIGAVLLLPPEVSARAFGFGPLLMTAGVLVAAPRINACWPGLGWLDAPFASVFRLEGEGADGVAREIARGDMGPYELAFGQGRFGFVDPRPSLVGTCGTIRGTGAAPERLFDELLASDGDPGAIEAVRERHGVARLDPPAAQAFDAFLRAYFAHTNEHGRTRRPGFGLRAPIHFWFARPRERYMFDQPLVAVRVCCREVYHADEKEIVVSDRVVRRVELVEQRLGSRVRAVA